MKILLACEQAHLVCYSREYLGGAAISESASEACRREECPILLAGWLRSSDFLPQDTRANNTLSGPARMQVKFLL